MADNSLGSADISAWVVEYMYVYVYSHVPSRAGGLASRDADNIYVHLLTIFMYMVYVLPFMYVVVAPHT